MNLWNKIVLGSKFIIGGFEAATDYLLELLNSFIGKENIANKIQKALEFASTVLKYMKKYEKYCPAIWASDYLKLIDVLQVFVNVLDDAKVTPDELQDAISTMQNAIDEWMK